MALYIRPFTAAKRNAERARKSPRNLYCHWQPCKKLGTWEVDEPIDSWMCLGSLFCTSHVAKVREAGTTITSVKDYRKKVASGRARSNPSTKGLEDLLRF